MNKRDDDDDDGGYDGTKAGVVDLVLVVLLVLVVVVLVLVLPLLPPVLCRRAMHPDTAGVTVHDVTVHAVIVVVVELIVEASSSTLDIDATDDEATGILDLLLRELVELIIIERGLDRQPLRLLLLLSYPHELGRIGTDAFLPFPFLNSTSDSSVTDGRFSLMSLSHQFEIVSILNFAKSNLFCKKFVNFEFCKLQNCNFAILQQRRSTKKVNYGIYRVYSFCPSRKVCVEE
jgi:hypothetical protein